MKNTVIRYGMYGAITICALFLIGWFLMRGLDYGTQGVIGYASMVVSLLFVYFGIKHFRDKENNGKVSFKKALVIGLLITLITAIAFGIIDVIYVKYINPDFYSEYEAYYVAELKEQFSGDALDTQVKAFKEQMEAFSNPAMNFFVMFATVTVIGFIITLLSALILQRK